MIVGEFILYMKHNYESLRTAGMSYFNNKSLEYYPCQSLKHVCEFVGRQDVQRAWLAWRPGGLGDAVET